MPSIILTGYPCSGKTTFAHLLADRALNHKSKAIHHVIIVNEEMARPDQTKIGCYDSSNAEKFTRGALKAEFDKYCRSTSIKSSVRISRQREQQEEAPQTKESTLVILDSMNYIKGFRYELHCIAKDAGQKHAVIWLLCTQDVAKNWDAKRRAESKTQSQSYSEPLMDELMQRFEPPDQRNRWDQPLYRVDVNSTLSSEYQPCENETKQGSESGNVAENILNRSVYNMHSLREAIHDSSQTVVRTSKTSFRRMGKANTVLHTQPADRTNTVTPPLDDSNKVHEPSTTPTVRKMEDLIDDILDSFISDVQPLKQGTSTKAEISANVNVLNDVDSICQQVINDFIHSQKMLMALGSGGGGKISIPLTGGKNFSIDCKRSLQLIELRRLMRMYIKILSNYPPTDTSKDGISISFLTYIGSQM